MVLVKVLEGFMAHLIVLFLGDLIRKKLDKFDYKNGFPRKKF